MTELVRLSNGVTLVLAPMEQVRSTAAGIWVGTGSRHESRSDWGISHCLEHMVFKGTSSKSAADIANITDAMGGQFNAFTTKESTAFYARTLTAHLPRALDVLTDLFFEPTLSETDLEPERNVILEEIDMYLDTPEDLVGERLFSAVYPKQALGRSILGSPSSLRSLNSARLRKYMARRYRPPHLVVSLCGRFSDADVQYMSERFSVLAPAEPSDEKQAEYTPAFTTARKSIEQNHLCLAFPGLPIGDSRRYALQLLCGLLGGSASSRLYQCLREEHGLCYSVNSYTVSHTDTGLLCFYTALSRETEAAALSLMLSELTRFASDGPAPEELDRQREQLKAGVVLNLESTGALMSHAARNALFLDRVPSSDELIERFDAVTCEQVLDLARQLMVKPSFSAVGRVSPAGEYRNLISKAFL
jgi:predicted Zn-dependent peptidase